MSDLNNALGDLLDGGPNRKISVRCFVGTALEDLPTTTRELFQQVIDSDIPAARVAEVLAENSDIDLSAGNINRHRKRGTPSGCKCPLR